MKASRRSSTHRKWLQAHMRNMVLGGIALAASGLTLPSTTAAQYMYLDADGDSKLTAADQVSAAKTNTVDVWLQTNTNADGTAAKAAPGEAANLTFNSYEFILRAEGGKVEFVEYTNLQPTMVIPIIAAKDNTEMYVGFAGPDILPPGKYRLGRLSFRVIEGSPKLVFAGVSKLGGTYHTSFGSRYMGSDGDNTLKLMSNIGADAATFGTRRIRGDWTDAAELPAPSTKAASSEIAGGDSEDNALRFAARVQGEGRGRDVSLTITITRPGPLTVRIYDARGRLTKELMNAEQTSMGAHVFKVQANKSSGLAAGVYFYKVLSSEGNLTGRLVLLK